MYTVLVTAGKILSVFLAWLITRLHPFHRIHPLRPKWMLLVSFFPLTSLFMLIALFLICRDQRELTQPVAFFCIFLGIANVAIVYVISLIERDTEVKQQINLTMTECKYKERLESFACHCIGMVKKRMRTGKRLRIPEQTTAY